MTRMILEVRTALARPVKRPPAVAMRRLAGLAITASGAAVLVGQAAHHAAAVAGG